MFRFEAGEADDGVRLDAFLAESLSRAQAAAGGAFSRARVQRLIDEGRARLDGSTARASARVHAGAVAEIAVPAPRPIAPQAEDIPLPVLYQDDDLIVVDKPAGLAAHAGAGRDEGTLVNALLAKAKSLSGIGDALRPGIVHRLDKDTSGVLVAAKSDRAHLSLAKQFHDHSVERRYQALVHGAPPETLTIDAPLGRDPRNRKRFAVVEGGGKRAVTHACVLERFSLHTLVECRLETGRTHQIRVHLASKGFPLVGDKLYGRKDGAPRQMLHAFLLAFRHPVSGAQMRFTTPPPADMQAEIAKARG